MCLFVYIAADKPLPLIRWDETAPAFYVSDEENAVQAARAQFSKPYVYHAGSHEGCGCGFAYGQYPITRAEHEETARKARDSVARLSDYVRDAVGAAGPVELFASWSGDESKPPNHRGSITSSEIGGEAFWFEERSLLTIAR